MYLPLIILFCNNFFVFFSLEIWPGFITSIAQYESNVMLCADISHKILRTDTVLDLFHSLKSMRDFHTEATKNIVGEIVLTRLGMHGYNKMVDSIFLK